jgi:hypothetical protein
MKNILGDIFTGCTTYVIHPGIFIKKLIMAENFQPSDKMKLIFILFLTMNMYDKSQTKVPYGLVL